MCSLDCLYAECMVLSEMEKEKCLKPQVVMCDEGMEEGVRVKVEGGGSVGRMVDSSQADDRLLIRLVRERRLLYARNNMPVASYYTKVKNLWQDVATNMGWSGTYIHTYIHSCSAHTHTAHYSRID